MNSLIAETVSQNQTLHWYITYNWSYSQFCEIFAYFGQNVVAMATSLRSLQSEISLKKYFLIGCPLKPYHITKKFVNNCYTSASLFIFETFDVKRIFYRSNGKINFTSSLTDTSIQGFPPNTIGYHISWYTTKMASLVKIGGRLRPVERSTLFVWQTDSLTDTHKLIFTARRFASAVLAIAIPSVCPSVRPTHAGIVSKRRTYHGAVCTVR